MASAPHHLRFKEIHMLRNNLVRERIHSFKLFSGTGAGDLSTYNDSSIYVILILASVLHAQQRSEQHGDVTAHDDISVVVERSGLGVHDK
jgi:hypothetical protein